MEAISFTDILFIFVGVALLVFGAAGVFFGIDDNEKGPVVGGVAMFLMGLVMILTNGVQAGMGYPRPLKSLPAGTYHVQGEVNTGGWRALWLTPLDSDSGMLYELPREQVPTNFGPYVQKKSSYDDKLESYKFAGK